MRVFAVRVALAVGLTFVTISRARADAVVVTRAMTASTIAEVRVEEDGVRVELEIGVSDLVAFADLLPEELRERLGLEPEPVEQRHERFFAQGWVLRSDTGDALPGTLVGFEGRARLVRDDITGEPVPAQPADAEAVVFVQLAFALEGRPKALSLRPPLIPSGRSSANIGFVLYHEGVAVNDFRYLSGEETVELDWGDPWYSQFENRNLWRQYRSPISAFLYVESFEVRKEVVLRPRDLQRWVDLGLEGRDVIRAEDWGTLQQAVADYLMARCPVRIDGREIEPVLDRVHFIERGLLTTSVIAEPRDLPLVSATLGVIFVYPVTELPEEVTMEWELFPPNLPSVPSAATDEAGGLPSTLTPDDNVLRWKNFLTNPTVPGLVELEPPPAPPRIPIPLVSLACAGLALVAILRRRGGVPAGVGALALGVVAAVAWPYARVHASNPLASSAAVSEEDAGEVVGGLLRNVYHAFDFRVEEQIYDTLAKSASGELLTDVYLETRKALELENQGGARARVQEVEIVATDTHRVDGTGGFGTRCTWNVIGAVGHWGHIHQRRNQYEAELMIEPVDGRWTITDLELLSEARL